MDGSFAALVAILTAIGIAGIIGGSITHPIMYANSAIIFGFLGLFGFQIIRERKEQ